MSEEGNYKLGGKCPDCGMYAVDTFATITIDGKDYDNCTFCGYLAPIEEINNKGCVIS